MVSEEAVGLVRDANPKVIEIVLGLDPQAKVDCCGVGFIKYHPQTISNLMGLSLSKFLEEEIVVLNDGAKEVAERFLG